jgi:hypothetical protein
MKTFLIGAASIIVAGCAAPSATTVSANPTQAAAAHNQPVCLLRTTLPANVRYSVLGPIEASKEFYGSANELIPLMAQEARNIGADAIISMQTGQKIGVWAWSRPYGMGTAVKLENKADLNCAALGGEMK